MKARKLTLTALLATFAAGCLITLQPTPAAARAPETYTSAFSNLAVGGYDPVAYFEDGKPVRGTAALSFAWKGAEYRFSTPERLARFKAAPEAYAPQFGGYCAWAVSQGYLAKGDPRFWTVVGGKLYLNYDATIQKRWAANMTALIARGHANWPRVLN